MTTSSLHVNNSYSMYLFTIDAGNTC